MSDEVPMPYQSYWTRSSGTSDYPPLSGRVSVDVAVVGGGFTGLWSAWELAGAGLRVALLEAGRVAASTTANTLGAASALPAPVFGDLAAAHGRDVAGLYGAAQADAVERIAGAVDQLEVDCGFERLPAFLYSASEWDLPALRSEAAAAVDAGLPARWVADPGLPFDVAGAVRLDGQAQFHPRQLALALAADIVRRGSAVYERTRITGLDDGEPCVAVTEDGASVVADHLVIATGYPISASPAVRHALTVRRRLAVAALAPESAAPPGMFATRDSARTIRSAPARDGERLIVVGGELFKPGAGGVRARFAALMHWVQEHLGLERVDHRWSVQELGTADGLPLIGRTSSAPDQRHTWIATGLGGNGLVSSVLAGRVLAAAVAGDDPPPWAPIFDPGRPAAAGREGGQRNGVARFAVRHRIGPAEKAAAASVARGQGKVVAIGGEHCAVYRDDSGILHAVSALCSHLGCVVGFNDAERTWECPCHGSRFGVDGEVLQGPAVRPLNPALALMEVSAR